MWGLGENLYIPDPSTTLLNAHKLKNFAALDLKGIRSCKIDLNTPINHNPHEGDVRIGQAAVEPQSMASTYHTCVTFIPSNH